MQRNKRAMTFNMRVCLNDRMGSGQSVRTVGAFCDSLWLHRSLFIRGGEAALADQRGYGQIEAWGVGAGGHLIPEPAYGIVEFGRPKRSLRSATSANTEGCIIFSGSWIPEKVRWSEQVIGRKNSQLLSVRNSASDFLVFGTKIRT